MLEKIATLAGGGVRMVLAAAFEVPTGRVDVSCPFVGG